MGAPRFTVIATAARRDSDKPSVIPVKDRAQLKEIERTRLRKVVWLQLNPTINKAVDRSREPFTPRRKKRLACGLLHIIRRRFGILQWRFLISNEVLMKQFPSNLSEEDLRTYRRWTRGVYLSYLAAIIVAIAVTFLRGAPSDLRASTEVQIARLKASSASIDVSSAAKP